MAKIVLSAYQLLVDGVYADHRFFNQLKSKIDEHYGRNSVKIEDGSTMAYARQHLELSNDYFYLDFKLGSDEDYTNFVIDTVHDNEQKPNPKRKEEIEPIEEIIMYYSFRHNELLLTTKSKTSFEKLLSLYFQDKNFAIKKLFKSFEDFVDGLKELTEIKIVCQDDNIFTDSLGYSEMIRNIYGFDSPESFEVKAVFKIPYLSKHRRKLDDLRRRYENHEFKKLVFVGKDDKDVERRLNIDKYSWKVEIEVEKNETSQTKAAIIIRKIREEYSK